MHRVASCSAEQVLVYFVALMGPPEVWLAKLVICNLTRRPTLSWMLLACVLVVFAVLVRTGVLRLVAKDWRVLMTVGLSERRSQPLLCQELEPLVATTEIQHSRGLP